MWEFVGEHWQHLLMGTVLVLLVFFRIWVVAQKRDLRKVLKRNGACTPPLRKGAKQSALIRGLD